MTANDSKSGSSRGVSILRRPTLGPLLFGVIFGGVHLRLHLAFWAGA